ncbi:fumarylacetoacetate hydrolase family protein [Specibacter cremeus]|uniref:fumarylacetoacetate hydrolase family protein n=1 Tax=Specibacter cremeus TaxID=1629051 RepID=UPI000F76A049|nr:fumarylacetoacetate hydrolase family protein [Specibacter cremeus]
MKIARLGEPGREVPVVLVADAAGTERVYDAGSLTSAVDGAFLAGDGIAKLRAAVGRGDLPELADAAALRVGSPISRPNNVVCIGMNYAAHAAESGSEAPTVPVVFLKPTNTVTGPFDPAPIPPLGEKYDWEVELGIVIGREVSYAASLQEAADAVAGYVTANDLSERAYQLPGAAGQWTKGKSLPKSTPLGPWLVPADEVDPSNLRLRSWVNGEPRQDSSTADLIFDVSTIVHHVSQYMLLEPGDVILTGTPEGVALSGRFPYLRDGDVVELEIEGLGRQRQVFHRAGSASTTTTAAPKEA